MPAKTWLADSFQPDFGIPWVKVPPKEELATWSTDKLVQYMQFRDECERNATNNPVGQGWIIPSWKKVMDNWKKYPVHVILGGNRCLRGDTLIYDPVLKVSRRIDSIKGRHHVYAWDGTKAVVAPAEEPFRKDRGMMAEVWLSNGQRFVASLEHRVLSADGLWLPVSELKVGSLLFRHPSTLDSDLLGLPQDALRSSETKPDLKGDCRPCGHLCDEQPLSAQGGGQGGPPLPSDVPECTSPSDSSRRSLLVCVARLLAGIRDGLEQTRVHIRYGLKCGLLSIQDGLRQLAGLFAGIQSHVSGKPCRSVLPLCDYPEFAEGVRQSVAACFLDQSNHESGPQDTQCGCVLASVTFIRLAGIDVKWDMTVATYGNYEAGGVFHHNSSKSSLASRVCVWAAGSIPNAEVRAYHVNEDRSVEDQQRMIYDALPIGIKELPTKKGISHSLQYSQKNGFTDNICILPPIKNGLRGGQIKFANYRQYQADAQVAEGFKSHFIWCDEECPQKLFETLQYRTIDYHGRIFLTFTTLSGWTPLVQDILGKTRTLESKWAPLLGRNVPVMQESLSRPGTIIYYFHTEDNAFIDTSDFVSKIKGRPKDEILARAYGIPTKSVSSAFPGFIKDVNVVKHSDLPWMKDPAYKVTRYMAVDPAGSKNWFMLWVAIDASGTWWVYREWPDYDDWALAGTGVEGKAGPAQRGTRKGIQDYVELIQQMEDKEQIYERFIDPRLGAAEKQTLEGASTIIGDLDKLDMTFIPAPGVHIDDGLQLINNLLSYDESKPIDSLNAPKLFVSDRCVNFIYAMQEYTAKGGKDEATKDPIDCLRYLCVSKCEYFDEMDVSGPQSRTFSY